ncbi:MAG: DUF1345 domain-containing protein [Ferruginibacter sp.]
MKRTSETNISWINRLHASHKLLISLALGVIAYFLIPAIKLNMISHLMLGWDIGCFTMLLLSWISFFTITSQQIREQSKKQDETRVVIFLIVLVATLVSLTAVLLLLISKSSHLLLKETQFPIAVAGLMFSWILVHTIFAFRYAHIYYGNDKNDAGKHAEGLEFPDDKKPDYMDFAYFSFVIGMTFQVSDVEITSKRLRRLALLHGLIAFGFNTFIVALTINVIAGLTGK